MRIACLQFAPQVGDVDNNLHRADAVLAKANPDDLEHLDLMVLPELAFTGYNFKSLKEISPFLEPQGSGISALWARTTALKYDTNVIVGYPERVDVSARWPTGPEYYNSAFVVNGNGETIANYRKSFLYVIDETWALEGDDGFFARDIPGLGSTAMGICMDLNPYRFKAPWRAFEFAHHIQAIGANLVIVTMAWLTCEDSRHFTRMPEQPDFETLTYWVRRLEPLIRSEDRDEVIIVFCNRTGIEDDLVYAGTSSVVGIKDGEVKVYGILGRGVKGLLMVDTENGPFANLVQRPHEHDEIASHITGMSRRPGRSAGAPLSNSRRPSEPAPTVNVHSDQNRSTPNSEDSLKSRKTWSGSPRIQIPENNDKPRSVSHGTPIDESPGVATPTCPSPTPFDDRPQVHSSETDSDADYMQSQYRRDVSPEVDPKIVGGGGSFKGPGACTASPSLHHLPEKYLLSNTQPPIKVPMALKSLDVYEEENSAAKTPVPSSIVNIYHEKNHTTGATFHSNTPYSTYSEALSKAGQYENPNDVKDSLSVNSSNENQTQECRPIRPSSPKSRNASRTGTPLARRQSDMQRPAFMGTGERVESIPKRLGSAAESVHHDTEEPRQGRRRTRKSSVTTTKQPLEVPRVFDEALNHISPRAEPILARSRTFSDLSDLRAKSRSSGYNSRDRTNSRPATLIGAVKSHLDFVAPPRKESVTGYSASLPRSRSGSMGKSRVRADAGPHMEPDETRTVIWSELFKMVGEVLDQPQTRDISRGRLCFSRHPASSSKPSLVPKEAHSETRHGIRMLPRAEQGSVSQTRSSRVHPTPMRTIPAPDGTNRPASLDSRDDDIVAEIIFHSRGRVARSQINSPEGNTSRTTSSQASTTASASLHQRTALDHTEGSESMPQQHRKPTSRTRSVRKRQATLEDPSGVRSTHRASEAETTITPTEWTEPSPATDGASILASTTPQTRSPATLPWRVFKPTTPKPMNLDSEPGTIHSYLP